MPKKLHRPYTGRAQKLKEHKRVYRLIYLFGLLALAVWVIFNWRWIYDYVRTFFM